IGGALVVRTGDPARVIPGLAALTGAREVHISRESTPYGRRRDTRVRAALEADGRRLVETGSPYAVGPGRVLNGSGRPYARWRAFLEDDLEDYGRQRDRPDLDATSRLSAPLKYGEIHPRTILADLGAHPAADGEGARRFVTELAWREFYANVLWHQPRSAWRDLRDAFAGMPYDRGPEVDDLVEAWRRGRTGFPFVDAGMRQLLAQGWMHNRVRMVTASFLVKDLHVWWPVGARHFLDHLLDGDLASNNHGWQWVAGTGTDASPFFRIFNPVTQGQRFDPDGDYVRRWVPELRHLPGAAVHEPWRWPDGHDHGYPERIVDHAEERLEALRRYDLVRDRSR
ncbi:deoxyribodipyrimidine photo-lyase, partial [Dietzia sp. E1]|uniref:cryptochrome/photolyase family protein n=1 Tax=Dietzia sp. E1 TaxID=328361 RepID=UPI0015FC6160